MTATETRKAYTHDANGRITQPGKFENEPIFAPYFWDLALEGLADRDNGRSFDFKFDFSDIGMQSKCDIRLLQDWPELKRWLGRKRTLKLVEDSQGFVHCL
jgi:hypothetical protein